jgi:peptidoglycan/LPS O-acetylase OafA/YrhL
MSPKGDLEQKSPKRQDIQVLRGLSVLAVVLYHLNFQQLRGGFLGVDVFFVISGFVITETILRSSGTLKTRLIHFYSRRAKRILPAATFVGILTFLGSVIFLPRPYFGKYLFDAVCSFFMVSNAGFAYQNLVYLNQGLNPSPFLHYWSLAVEEQFYLFWPIVLIVVVKNRKVILYSALPALLLLALVTTNTKPGFSYLSPSSRAWEFLAGAVLVFLPRVTYKDWVRRLLIPIASFGLLGSFIVITHESATPGFSTVIPVSCAALLIHLGFKNQSLSPIEWVGDISYSLYLIHWPLIVLANAIYGRPSLFGQFTLIAISFVLAKLISLMIESPFRFQDLKSAFRKFTFSLLAGVFGVILLAISTGFLANSDAVNFTISTSVPFGRDHRCEVRGAVPKEEGCDFGDIKSSRRVMLVGDSHASQFFPGLNLAAKRAGYKLTNFTKSGCPPFPIGLDQKKRRPDCVKWQQRITELIKEIRPDILVFANSTGRFDLLASNGRSKNGYLQGFDLFVSEVEDSVGKLVYVGDSAYPGEDSIACLTRNLRSPAKCDLKNVKPPLTLALEAKAKKSGIMFIDSRTFLCTPSKCPAVIDGKNVYRDKSHISVGIAGLVAKGLAPIFN